ncbi:10488_t:CDS:10 [Entrophospora sp. SA101]|nr:10488_t:CDS:10 [Entrophospora sp. SA101]
MSSNFSNFGKCDSDDDIENNDIMIIDYEEFSGSVLKTNNSLPNFLQKNKNQENNSLSNLNQKTQPLTINNSNDNPTNKRPLQLDESSSPPESFVAQSSVDFQEHINKRHILFHRNTTLKKTANYDDVDNSTMRQLPSQTLPTVPTQTTIMRPILPKPIPVSSFSMLTSSTSTSSSPSITNQTISTPNVQTTTTPEPMPMSGSTRSTGSASEIPISVAHNYKNKGSLTKNNTNAFKFNLLRDKRRNVRKPVGNPISVPVNTPEGIKRVFLNNNKEDTTYKDVTHKDSTTCQLPSQTLPTVSTQTPIIRPILPKPIPASSLLMVASLTSTSSLSITNQTISTPNVQITTTPESMPISKSTKSTGSAPEIPISVAHNYKNKGSLAENNINAFKFNLVRDKRRNLRKPAGNPISVPVNTPEGIKRVFLNNNKEDTTYKDATHKDSTTCQLPSQTPPTVPTQTPIIRPILPKPIPASSSPMVASSASTSPNSVALNNYNYNKGSLEKNNINAFKFNLVRNKHCNVRKPAGNSMSVPVNTPEGIKKDFLNDHKEDTTHKDAALKDIAHKDITCKDTTRKNVAHKDTIYKDLTYVEITCENRTCEGIICEDITHQDIDTTYENIIDLEDTTHKDTNHFHFLQLNGEIPSLLNSEKIKLKNLDYIVVLDMRDLNDLHSYEILKKFGVDETSVNNKIGSAFCLLENKKLVINSTDNGCLALWNISNSQQGLESQIPQIIINVFNEDYMTNKITSCDSRDDGTSVISSTSGKGQLIICDYKITSCHYNPYVETSLLTAGVDGTIKWWDTRKLKGILNNLPYPLHTFKKHIGGVNKVSWSPHIKSIFASCSDDNTVIIWNSENIDKEELGMCFTHKGHRTIASVSSSSEVNVGLLQVWSPYLPLL